MEFKKLTLWKKEEDEILLKHFHDMPFSSHNGSRFEMLKEKLEDKGFKRTESSIARRSFRLGLKSLELNEERILIHCKDCQAEVSIAKRYAGKQVRCKVCERKFQSRVIDPERNKKYHNQYLKRWRKENVTKHN